MAEDVLRQRIDAARGKLFAARAQRVRPGLDDKMLTGWNALMINAFALAAQILDARYLDPARRAAEFLWKTLRQPDGRLYRTSSLGHAAKLNAYLEDYAFTLDAFVTLYETDFDPRWIERAEEVAFLRTRGAAAASMRLREHADSARLSRLLSGIALDAPVPLAADDYMRRAMDVTAVEALFDSLKLGPLTRARVRALAIGAEAAASAA